MATKFLALLVCCSVPAIRADLLPQYTQPHPHQVHHQHLDEEHPIQKLSAGYAAPPHQYQVDEKEHHHQQQHFHKPPPSAYTVATTIPRRQQFQLQSDQSKVIEYEDTPIPVQHIKTIKYVETPSTLSSPPYYQQLQHNQQHSQRNRKNIEYTVQPSHTLAIFHALPVYEAPQNNAPSYITKNAIIYAATHQPQQHPPRHHFEQQYYKSSTPAPSTIPSYHHQQYHQHQSPLIVHHQQENVAPKYVVQHVNTQQHQISAVSQPHQINLPQNDAPHHHLQQHQQSQTYYHPHHDVILSHPQFLQSTLHVPQYEHNNVQQHIVTTEQPHNYIYQPNHQDIQKPSRGLSAPTTLPNINRPQQDQKHHFVQSTPHHYGNNAAVHPNKAFGYSPAETVSHTSFKSSEAQYAW